MSDFNGVNRSIAAIHRAMASGQITCRQVTESCLARIDAYDRHGPALSAVIQVNADALAEAEVLDRRFAAGGLTGPLHGIPVLLKDNIETAALPTTGGSLALAGYTPANDAWITRKLRQASALILAKVNLHEFAVWGETVSSVGGQTRNPYDLTRTPGGSSGGTGAGVAAGFGVAGIGTDTVNSVRSPASANCLVGLRPTVGLVSRQGIIPYSLTQDTAGPITVCVSDAAAVLDVIAGYDPGDNKTAWAVGHQPASYLSGLRADALKGKRLGVLTHFFGGDEAHREVNGVIAAGLGLLRDLGAVTVNIDEDIDSTRLVADTSVHLHDFNDDLSTYLKTLQPPPPVRSLKEVLDSGKFHPGIEANIRQALALGKTAPDYTERLLRQARLRDRLMQLMADNSLDAFVYPHQKRLAVPIGETQVDRNGVLAAITGFPAITLPAGFSAPSPTAPAGVPIGIEFLGRPWSEELLLAMAYAFEQAAGVRQPPPFTPPL